MKTTPAPVRYFALPLDTETMVSAALEACEILAECIRDGILGSDLSPEARAAVPLPRIVAPQGAGSAGSFLLVPSSSAAWLSETCVVQIDRLTDMEGSDAAAECDATEDLMGYIDAELLRAQRCTRAGF